MTRIRPTFADMPREPRQTFTREQIEQRKQHIRETLLVAGAEVPSEDALSLLAEGDLRDKARLAERRRGSL